MPRLAVLGHPISHSRSPAMHTAALAELGLARKWSYEAIEVAPEHFAELVASLPGDGFAGVNVTVPHKLAALALATEASAAAREIGAANTLSFSAPRRGRREHRRGGGHRGDRGSGRRPAGARARRRRLGPRRRVGASQRGRRGLDLEPHRRQGRGPGERARGRTRATSNEQRATPHRAASTSSSTPRLWASPRQASGQPRRADLKALPFDADSIGARQVVVDLVYGSHETALASCARERGASVIDGLEVLVHQGAASLRIWTGLDPPIETMRRAARTRNANG